MKKFNPQRALILIVIALLFVAADYYKNSQTDGPVSSSTRTEVEQAYSNKRQAVQVTGVGTVVKLLPDDLDGSKHQKFIVQTGKNLTILIAHNIDLAPKITSLQQGDSIWFFGEYEYNPKGGVVHWTHHDPGKRHPDGWLKHDGKLYQ